MRTKAHKEIYLVSWKKQKNHIEIFNGLKTFVASYPRYNFATLGDALSFGKTVFEDDDVRIERKNVISSPKPDFPPMFFWDFKYDRINWQASYNTVIQRVLERGFKEDWTELIRYYGTETIIKALKENITFLPDESIAATASFFNLLKEEMLCYRRKQSQKIPWL